jgi:hypothetical protein
LASEIVGDMAPTFRWLGYERHDQPGFMERLAGSGAEGEWKKR